MDVLVRNHGCIGELPPPKPMPNQCEDQWSAVASPNGSSRKTNNDNSIIVRRSAHLNFPDPKVWSINNSFFSTKPRPIQFMKQNSNKSSQEKLDPVSVACLINDLKIKMFSIIFLSYQLITSALMIICVCLFLNGLDESSKTVKRQQGPGDDIADVEHLLDDQPTSEFTLTVQWLFSLCCVCLMLWVCTLNLTSSSQLQRQSGRSRKQEWPSDFSTQCSLTRAKPRQRVVTSHRRPLQSSMNPPTPPGRRDAWAGIKHCVSWKGNCYLFIYPESPLVTTTVETSLPGVCTKMQH